MDRLKEYAGFAAWYLGLGYLVLWPWTAAEPDGRPFGAAILCRGDAPGHLDFLCHATHPLWMSPGLHAIGFVSTMFVTLRLMGAALKRSRRASSAAPPSGAAAVPPRPQARPPLRKIKPRTEFGLRGVPR